MYHKLYQLSELLPTGREDWERLNEGMPENYDRGVAICFDVDGEFAGCRRYDRREEVLYRRATGPTGADFTPCSKQSSKPHSTFSKLARATGRLVEAVAAGAGAEARRAWLRRVEAQLEACSRFQSPDARERAKVAPELAAPAAAMAASFQEVIDAAGVDKEHYAYLFVARLEGDRIDALYLWPEARQVLVEQFLPSCDGGTKLRGVCSVSGRRDVDVLGNFSLLKCYSLDKPGSIAGGFDERSRAARNFPVAVDVAVPLAEAITHAQQKLSARSYGLEYMVLPVAVSVEARDYLRKQLEQEPERLSLGKARDLLGTERDIIEFVQEVAEEGVGDHVGFGLVYYQSEKASWRITAEVQQVLPSRVSAIQAARVALERDAWLNNFKTGEAFVLHTGTLKLFTGDAHRNSLDLLREWLVALFEERSIQRAPFVHRLVQTILSRQRSEKSQISWLVLSAWAVYRFALATGLILPEKEPSMQPDPPRSPYGEFCRERPEFFVTQERVTAFLVGCYCATVASVQYKARNSRPFERKYRGRLVDGRLLRRLWSEGRDKLAAYDALGIVANGLDPDVAEAFVACGDHWRDSDDDTTFAFNLGLSLQKRIFDSSRASTETSES